MKKILIPLFSIALFSLSFSKVDAQLHIRSEPATCNIKVNNKEYNLTPNQIGYFQRIANIERLTVVPIEIFYSEGNSGEKVVLNIIDGGKLDNDKAVKVVLLNAQKKCSFNFQVTNQLGLFRIAMRKGSDTKIIQLWVGAEPAPVER